MKKQTFDSCESESTVSFVKSPARRDYMCVDSRQGGKYICINVDRDTAVAMRDHLNDILEDWAPPPKTLQERMDTLWRDFSAGRRQETPWPGVLALQEAFGDLFNEDGTPKCTT